MPPLWIRKGPIIALIDSASPRYCVVMEGREELFKAKKLSIFLMRRDKTT